MCISMVTFGMNFAVSRYAVRHGLSAFDLVFFRFAIGGLLLLPFFIRRGAPTCIGIGWGRGFLLAMTSGAPITLLMSVGVTLAPAAHGAALGPGTVTVVGFVYAAVVAGIRPPRIVVVGFGFVLLGLATVAIAGTESGSTSVVLGDLCFFVTGLLWGFYPVLLHRWRVGGMEGAAICAVLSLVYVPIYFAFLEPRLLQASLGLVLFQALYQGVMNSIVALWLWGQGVKVLGASGTQYFPPLIPVIGAAAAVPILGEWPGPIQAAGIVLIVGGLALSAYAGRKPTIRA